MKARRTTIFAALAATIVTGVLAGAGSAGTNGIANGNIVFAGTDPADGMSDIYVMKADGTAKSNITHDDAVRKDVTPAWSPDGSKVVFTRYNAGGGSSIMLVNANGSGLKNLTAPATNDATNVDPSWSPDGNHVVFASNRDGNFDLYELKLGSPQAYHLTKTSAPVQNLDPSWSPTGKAIVYSRSDNRTATSAAQLFQLKVETLEASRLTKPLNGRGDRGPVYSPDGTQVAFYSDRNGNQDLYLLTLASGYVQQLAASPQSDTEPSFAPDGSALVFVSTRSGSTQLWATNLLSATAGSQATQLTFDKQYKAHPGWGRATQTSPIDPPSPVTTLAPSAAIVG
jgi:Tol biopolymer transport system component